MGIKDFFSSKGEGTQTFNEQSGIEEIRAKAQRNYEAGMRSEMKDQLTGPATFASSEPEQPRLGDPNKPDTWTVQDTGPGKDDFTKDRQAHQAMVNSKKPGSP